MKNIFLVLRWIATWIFGVVFLGVSSLQAGTPAWVNNGDDIYYDSGFVGVGTTSPIFPLQISQVGAQLVVEDTSISINTRTLLTLRNRGRIQFRLENIENGASWSFDSSAAGNNFFISKGGTGFAELEVADNGDLRARRRLISANSLVVDGTTDTITATSGTIGFEDDNLMTAGTTTTQALTISGLDCGGNANGGVLTANAEGIVTCVGAGPLITADAGPVVIAGSGGLELDGGSLLQQPGDPSLMGSLSLGGFPQSVYISGRIAYVVDQASDDLKVIDVSNPEAPGLIGILGIGPEPRAVFVAAQYAYVIDDVADDLKVIDVSNSSAPVLVGSLSIGILPISIYVSGSYAYVTDADAGDLKVIDISDPTLPSLVGRLVVGNFPRSIHVVGSYAYIADTGSNELQIVDVSNPSHPALVGTLALGGNPTSVSVSGRYAYVVDGNSNEMQVVDISNPAMPSSVSSLGIGGGPQAIVASGRYAYVVDSGPGDLKVIDVLDPLMPRLVGSLVIGPNPFDIKVTGRYAYVIDTVGNDLKILDVSGGEVASMVAHSLEAGHLQVRNDIIAGGQLQVSSGVHVGGGGIFSLGDAGFGRNVYVSGDLTVSGSCSGCTSDQRLKQNIRPLAGILGKLSVLNPVHFDWIPGIRENRSSPGRQWGLIAQEVEAVFPELVGVDTRGFKFVDYPKLTAPLISALQELRAEKDAELAQLRTEKDTEIEALKERLTALEKKLEELVLP